MTLVKLTDLPKSAQAKITAQSAPKPATGTTTPPAGQTSQEGPQSNAKRPAALRARYAIAKFPGYEGARMVFTGLDATQVTNLQSAAAEAGIYPENP